VQPPVFSRSAQIEPMEASYVLSKEKVVPIRGESGPAAWRDRLFATMARNAGSVTDFFNLPTNRVVELGTRVEIQPPDAAERASDVLGHCAGWMGEGEVAHDG
jgi:hypothetical protein